MQSDPPRVGKQQPQSREHKQEQRESRERQRVRQRAERSFLGSLGHADEDHADRLALFVEERAVRADGAQAAEIGAAKIRRAAREHDLRDSGVRLLSCESLAARIIRRGRDGIADEERNLRACDLLQVIDEAAVVVEQSAALVDATILHGPIAWIRRIDEQEDAAHVGVDLLLPDRRIRRARAVVGVIPEAEEGREKKDRKKDDAAPQPRCVILAEKESGKGSCLLVVFLHINEPP